ncbi:hypothetical protein [Acidovorax sp. NO-1]|uniref:WapI family immunity protein n=1 Tax=Acidovorax sp. NO-1 TaxID=512030 RepID=UPI001ED93812|nr:hypothetical protein [Acidovorax sp. NO-1]
MLEISLPDFRIALSPLERKIEGSGGPYFDWIHLQVSFQTAGLTANFQWNVMPGELSSFEKQLRSIYLNPTSQVSAKLESVEPGLYMRIDSNGGGNLIITYSFQPTPPDGPELNGVTGADQSFLPTIIAGISEIINFH